MLTVEAATTRRATATGGDASLRHQSVLCVVPQRTPENWRAFAGEGRRVRCGSIIGPYAAKGPELVVYAKENDPLLVNQYHVVTLNPDRFPRANAAGGAAFADFLVSPEGQEAINCFGSRHWTQPLFRPAAGQDDKMHPTP